MPEPQPPARPERPEQAAPPPAAELSGIDLRTPTAYLPGLDGLRAVAVVAVVLYHLGELPGGFLGVDVFFVVSGFLITRLLLAEHERTGRVGLGAFWLRRFKRLVPALLVLLAVVAVGSKAWLPAWRLTDIRNDALGALAYVANWRFVWSGQSYFTQAAAPSPLRHTWSLAIEEQFYVLWPLLVVAAVALGRRNGRRAVALLSGIGALASATWMAVAAGGHDLSRVYYGTDTRVFALCAGAWLSTWWDPAVFGVPDRRHHRVRSRRLARGALACLLPLAALFALGAEDARDFYRFGFQLTAILSVVIVAGTATGRGAVGRAFRAPPLVWIGRRSYSIYLWSWPTQVFAGEHFRADGLALDAVVLGGALALAALSYWLVEEPVRRGRWPAGLGRRTRRDAGSAPALAPRPHRIPRPALSLLAVVAVAGVIVTTAAGAPEAPTYIRTSNDEAVDAALAPGDGPTVTLPRTTTSRPTGGELAPLPPGPFDAEAPTEVDPTASVDPATVRGRPLKVMVAGDSVGWTLAWHLGPGLTRSLKLEDRALIGCGVMPADTAFIVGSHQPERYGTQCQKAALAESRGLSSSPDAVLLVVGAWEVYDHTVDGKRLDVGEPAYRTFLERRLQERIDLYRSVGAGTIIPRVPCFAPNAARLGDERHQQRRLRWVNARVDAVAARNPGWVRIVDPFDRLCDGPDDAKVQTADGIPLRQDGAHFEPEAAVWLWNTWLAGQVGAAFTGGTTPWPPPTTTTTPAPPTTATAPPATVGTTAPVTSSPP